MYGFEGLHPVIYMFSEISKKGMFNLQLNNLDFITFLTNFAALFKHFIDGNELDVSFLCRKRHFFSSSLVSSERLIFVGGMNCLETGAATLFTAEGDVPSVILRDDFLRCVLDRDTRIVRASISSTSTSTR